MFVHVPIPQVHSFSHPSTEDPNQTQKIYVVDLRLFGLPSTLQAELGIPPLMHYQMKQLASSHFRLTNIHKHSILGQIYAFRSHNLRNLHQTDLEKRIIQDCQTIFTAWSPSEPLPQPKYLERVLIQNREKSFGRSLHAPISAI